MATRTPIIIGPWTGEVGYELLYWIPFVRWVVETLQIPREQLFVISRGGTSSWYGDLAYRYADVFSFVTFDEWTAPGAHPPASSWTEVKRQKRLAARHGERLRAEVLYRVQQAYNLPHVVPLRPEIMQALFNPVWGLEEPIEHLRAYTRYAPITAPALGPELPLSDYVAIRFYASWAFPTDNRAFAQEVIDRVSQYLPVVLLNQPYSVDDHSDLGAGPVYAFNDAMALASNLEVQTAVIGRAKAFVGTYGGLSYLAPFLGVPSVGVHTALRASRLQRRPQRLAKVHLDVATHIFAEWNQPFLVFDAKVRAEKVVRRTMERLGW